MNDLPIRRRIQRLALEGVSTLSMIWMLLAVGRGLYLVFLQEPSWVVWVVAAALAVLGTTCHQMSKVLR